MKEIDIKLEALMGKLLDGEAITPTEQQSLDEALQQDVGARELFKQMRLLKEYSREAVTTKITDHSSGFEEVERYVSPGRTASSKLHVFKFKEHLRFITGLAAGFILGLFLHFVLIQGQSNTIPSETPTRITRNFPEEDFMGNENISTPTSDRYQPVIRNVDWYRFTDRAGRQWLVQGVREGVVHPAVYNKELY